MPQDISEFFASYSNPSENVNENEKRTQLLAVKDRILYAWTKNGLRAAVGLKYLSNDQSSQRKCTFEFEVKFVLTRKPEKVVEWIELNRSGSCLAICCERRVYVVFLPRPLWLLRSLNEIETDYLCRCVSIDNELTKKSKDLKCLRIRWHPGSLTDRHLVTLWTDDTLRIYNVGQAADAPLQISLGSEDLVSSSLKTRLMRMSLGESAVSFDFGAPLDVDENSDVELWPIFILCGNGDVYSFMSDLKRNKRFPVIGPLVISPSTDNNYGADSCDIAFLHGKLPLLVIATTYGILYHALVVRDEKSNSPNQISFELHVYESVELEFALSTVDLTSADVKEDNDTSSIVLVKDPLISRRYYACHRAGLHLVELPWAQDLENDSNRVLTDVSSNVEYVLCTAPKRSADAPESCPIGIVVVNSVSSDSTIIVLLSDFSIYCFPSNYDAVASLTSKEKLFGSGDATTKRSTNRDYFIDTVKRILQKGATVPILRARGGKQISEQEAAELMCRCVEVLRKEYVERLLNARDACGKRTAELGEIFAQQNQDLLRLEQSAKSLKERSSKSAKRRQELAERQRILFERLEKITENISGGENGQLSIQEETMLHELNELKETVGNVLDEVAHLKEQIDSVTVDQSGERGSLATPTRVHEVMVKKRLEEQQHQIESLLRAVKTVQNEM